MAANTKPVALVGATEAVCRHATVAGTAQPAQSNPHGQETADAWAAIVAYPAPGWRVIVCRDGMQWILQRRKNGGAERPWRAVGYCRTREALLRLCATSCGQLDPIAASILAAFPENIGIGGGT